MRDDVSLKSLRGAKGTITCLTILVSLFSKPIQVIARPSEARPWQSQGCEICISKTEVISKSLEFNGITTSCVCTLLVMTDKRHPGLVPGSCSRDDVKAPLPSLRDTLSPRGRGVVEPRQHIELSCHCEGERSEAVAIARL